MIDPIFSGIVECGKLKLRNRESFEKYVANLSGDVQVIVRRPRKPRSDQENRYYWAVIIKILSEETGYFAQEIHEALKIKFLQIEGARFPVAKSTSDLSTSEAEDYYSKIRIWASAELNCYIPEPNQVSF